MSQVVEDRSSLGEEKGVDLEKGGHANVEDLHIAEFDDPNLDRKALEDVNLGMSYSLARLEPQCADEHCRGRLSVPGSPLRRCEH